MLQEFADALGTSRGVAVAIAVLLVGQVALQITALVDLARRRATSVIPNKWLWALVILLGNLLGAVLYLAIGRSATPLLEEPGAPEAGERDAANRARAAADVLYGSDERP